MTRPTGEETGRGRPAVGPSVHVRLRPEQLDRVDARAREVGRSRAEVLRDVVDAAFPAA